MRSLVGSVRRRLARRSLKPQLNQIRTWVRQGRTDAWIAHQLEVSVSDIRSFKREHELVPDDSGGDGDEVFAPGPGSEELDLRAEDDALVAAALEAEQDGDEDEDEDGEDEATRTRTSPGAAAADGAAVVAVAAGRRSSRAPSTTATRATASGSTRPSRTTRCTPSTGPGTGP